MKCPRCEAMGREPGEAIYKAIAPGGIPSVVCKQCIDEIRNIAGSYEHENEED
jgi:hypothetical protein